MKITCKLNCCAADINSFPKAFVAQIFDLGLLIRSVDDEMPNVVINLSDIDSISESFPDVYKFFRLISDEFDYIFISMDFTPV